MSPDTHNFLAQFPLPNNRSFGVEGHQELVWVPSFTRAKISNGNMIQQRSKQITH